MTLYQLTDAFLSIYSRIDESTGEMSPEDEAELKEFMDKLSVEEPLKLDRCIAFIQQMRMESQSCRTQAQMWVEKARAREARADRLETELLVHLQRTKRDRITTASGRVIAVQLNGGNQPVVYDENIDPNTLPPEFRKVDINKANVLIELKCGRKLDFARLGERGKHLRIR